jgi:D-sedoheptulose 7-phosphate isomerase
VINFIQQQIQESYDIKKVIYNDLKMIKLIEKVSKKTIKAYRNGNKTIIAGNGGSAGDAQHISAEFVGRFAFDRDPLPSIALTTDSSILTAVGNDYGYKNIFSRQIQANGVTGDIFIAISTSGNSKNIIKAVKQAKSKGIITIGLTNSNGGKMKDLCDYCICVPSMNTARVQEAHIMIGHIICAIVEEKLFRDRRD